MQFDQFKDDISSIWLKNPKLISLIKYELQSEKLKSEKTESSNGCDHLMALVLNYLEGFFLEPDPYSLRLGIFFMPIKIEVLKNI